MADVQHKFDVNLPHVPEITSGVHGSWTRADSRFAPSQ